MSADSNDSENRKSDATMPGWARVIAAVVGAVLCVGAVMVFVEVRPLGWKIGAITTGALGCGLDLLAGSIAGRWPYSALSWLWTL
jgi:hypothetical protein